MSTDERERQRLRQLAETAGSLAPSRMQRAVERETPPAGRSWRTASGPERAATVLIWIVLVGGVAAVGALMTARGYGVIVTIFLVGMVIVMLSAKRQARRRWSQRA